MFDGSPIGAKIRGREGNSTSSEMHARLLQTTHSDQIRCRPLLFIGVVSSLIRSCPALWVISFRICRSYNVSHAAAEGFRVVSLFGSLAILTTAVVVLLEDVVSA